MPDHGDDGEDPDGAVPLPASLISRPLAALVLVVLLAAGALSAWLVISADFESAKPPIRGAQDRSAPR